MLNQIDGSPGQEFAKSLRDNFAFFQDMLFESAKQQDNIVVWLVGMSTGAIGLAISGKFNPTSSLSLRVGVVFLLVTIILGLLFRIFHFLLQRRERRDLASVKGWLIGYTKNTTIPLIELPDNTSAEFIVGLLHRHMGLDTDVDSIKELAATKNVEEWRKVYQEYNIRSQSVEEAGQQSVKNMMEQLFKLIADLEGVPAPTYEQIIKPDRSGGIRKRCLRKCCTLFYIFMCISFAVSILFVSWGFITTDWKANQSSKTTSQQTISPTDQAQDTQTDKPE